MSRWLKDYWGIWVPLAVAVLVLLSTFAVGAGEQDRGLWFKSLRQPGTGMLCCDVADCHRTDSDYRQDHWWAVVQGKWTPVPDEKVLHNKTSIDGDAYICSSQYPSPNPTIYCFIPPPLGM